MKKQYDIFDLVKLICALMVVAIHAELFPNILYPWLDLAIPMFFVISSFLLFDRINNAKETNKTVKKYIIRLAKFYLFWFIVLLPYTIVKRKVWFNSGVVTGIIKTVINILFSSSFPASWFIIATIEGTIVVYMLRKVNNKVLFAVFLLIYLYIIIFEPVVITQYINLQHTFLRGQFYIIIGKMFADGDFNIISSKNKCLLSTIIFSVILFFLYRVNIEHEMKSYYCAVIPFAIISIFGFIKNVNIKINNAKILRQLSSFIYPTHILILGIIRAIITKNLPNETIRNTILYFLAIITVIIIFNVVKRLEQNKIFKILKYSY